MQDRATRSLLLLALSVFAFSAASASADAPEAAEPAPAQLDKPWMPADLGRTWIYEYVRERSRAAGTEAATIETLKGTLTEQIVRNAPEFGELAVELQAEIAAEPGTSEPAKAERRLRYLIPRQASYVEVARQELDPLTGVRELQRFAPALDRIKQGVPAGAKWSVGRWKAAGIAADFTGEILGVQDTKTPAGHFEKCLVVRTSAELAGSIEVSGARVEIDSGRYTATEWYAPGVGRVLVKEELEQTMTLPNGSTVEFRENTQFALSETQIAEILSPDAVEDAAPASPTESID